MRRVLPTASDHPGPKRIGDGLAAGTPLASSVADYLLSGVSTTKLGMLKWYVGARAGCNARPRPAGTREDDVAADEGLDSRDQSELTLGVDDVRVIADFAVGSSGVGPVMGFGSDDFFPSAPDPAAVPDNPRAGGSDAGSP